MTLVGAAAAVVSLTIGLLGVAPALDARPAEPVHDVSTLLDRVQEVEGAFQGAQDYYDETVAPIERVLLQYRDDPALVGKIARSVVQEANAAGLEPRLLVAVMLVENPWLDPAAESSVGAVGLMQVMPVHEGEWDGCVPDLREIRSNICHGARIFAHYVNRANGDVDRALLRYNGCVRGTNTPDCHRYPYHVYARAGRASMQAWLAATPSSRVGSAAAP
ncbi:MAG: lytic transglycosylase domain-containing protein [Gemmatimonadota bacterium]